jgi:O-antigen ligase
LKLLTKKALILLNRINRLLPSRENSAVFLSLAFVVGFLGARAILSIATLLLGLNALRGTHPRDWVRNRWWWLALGWVALYALSLLWSVNTEEWGERVQVKLPFLLFPLAVVYPLQLRKKHWEVLISGICVLLLGGMVFSLWHYFPDAAAIAKGYGSSQTIRTPAYNDHICFSAFVAATIFWIVAVWPKLSAPVKMVTGISAAILGVYLHILAAKTGLVMLYGAGVLLLFRELYLKHYRRFGGLMLAGILGCILAYAALPTLRGRIGYFRYSFMEYFSGRPSGNYSDPARLYSYDVAVRQIARSPWVGYGAGDVVSSMDSGYNQWHPDVATENRLVPHNQFLASGIAAGIPAMVLLALWWLGGVAAVWGFPERSRFFNIGIWLLVSVLVFVDPAFEVQFGIATFLFFQYWFRNLKSPETVS